MDLLKSMAVFIEVVDQGSMTAAAVRFELTPQMVGMHIKGLEQQFGTQFLHRTTRQLVLTEAGKLFYQHCQQVLGLIDETRQVINQLHIEAKGLLRLSAPATFGSRVIAPSLGVFRQLHPGVEVDLFLTDSVMDLQADEVEVAIRIGSLQDLSLVARPLGRYRMVIAASPDYLNTQGMPLHPEELANHQCLGFRLKQSQRHWHFQRGEEKVSVRIDDCISINNGEALRQAALAGAGVIMQPEVLLQQDFAQGTLIPLLTDFTIPNRPINMVYRQDRFASAKLKAIIDFGLQHWIV
ncbi:LysR family transcriptional regulator [Erwinia sp. S63]|uniref:LysR substrate-binding domain-containing protein n=1 Tax=Erwinia sp. S63 TaxID=2769341 RepID=UPI00190C8A3B|nr:LysR substrate-binding domain-containing protein [Erwinia sp. S63]MBK0097291.1 LysR family transcriptional regulator [Erwinia sp. S63]